MPFRPAACRPDLAIAEDPAWADIAPIPEGDASLRAEVEEGQFFLLSDRQIRWDGEVKQSWNRIATEVTDCAESKNWRRSRSISIPPATLPA